MASSKLGPVLNLDGLLAIVIHGHMINAAFLDYLGCSFERQAIAIERLDDQGDPVLRWFFDHLASFLRDPPPLRLIEGGKD